MPDIASSGSSGGSIGGLSGLVSAGLDPTTGAVLADLGNAATSAVGAVQDLYAAQGASDTASADMEAANEFGSAAALAGQNALIYQSSGQIQQAATKRALYQTQGTASADVGANGLRMSGSAADIIKANASQGSIQLAMQQAQTGINVKGALEQQTAYEAEQTQALGAAKTANEAAKSDTLGGILSGGSAVVSIGEIAGTLALAAGA